MRGNPSLDLCRSEQHHHLECVETILRSLRKLWLRWAFAFQKAQLDFRTILNFTGSIILVQWAAPPFRIFGYDYEWGETRVWSCTEMTSAISRNSRNKLHHAAHSKLLHSEHLARLRYRMRGNPSLKLYRNFTMWELCKTFPLPLQVETEILF